MAGDEDRIIPAVIEEEMRTAYLDYSMSVIVNRALPDVRDGLKPVQRRILVAMNDLNLDPSRPYRKSAKITGDVNGNYHPHGTSAIYDTMVRLAQDFSLRYPLVDGQGNFGSVDGDNAAAERYTEARLSHPAMETLSELDRETVDFRPNYENVREEPVVLPGRFPNLLCNGATGIAVGMATNIPPHNLGEIVDAICAVIDNPDTTHEEILSLVPGPDFPTGSIIMGRDGIRNAYLTGRGLVSQRARAEIEPMRNDREMIVITEIPYMVNKSTLLEKIADLVRSGTLTGISDLRDESDRTGMRVVVELKRDAVSQVVLNRLYKHTAMQTTFGVNLLALVNGRPETMSLKQMIEHFIQHRRDVIIRRTKYDLSQAEKRAHILEGLRIALDNIDAIVELIRASKDTAEAKSGLMSRFSLSDVQAQAILDMRLARLTGLERDKIEAEYNDLQTTIAELKAILASESKVLQIVQGEMLELKSKYADARRTEIRAAANDLQIEDLIADEQMVISISNLGYIKRLPPATYRRQRRGGRGVTGQSTRQDDFVEHLFIASTHAYILIFTNLGRVYWLKVHEIPQAGRTAKGKPVVNLVQMRPGEKIASVAATKDFDSSQYLFFATKQGQVKKTVLSDYGNPRRDGIIAIGLKEGDELIGVTLTDGKSNVILGKALGKAIRFNEEDVRPMGRSARGVRGVTLDGDEDRVVDMVVLARTETSLLAVTENGYGKRSDVDDYRVTGRGGKGIITIKASERNGELLTIKEVRDDDELMITTKNGIIIRLPVKDISVIGRNTQGVKLINLDDGDTVADVAKIANAEEDASTVNGGAGEGEANETEKGSEDEASDS
ncbi:MAG: DNA gyrase subunit A [Candidatus Eisenbacteria bacterium]|uniref:DNA gyrase subunit A n=1 Tax=Eiseniibacteriota bacterium TaxID=2212470 RepID=A0A7Y2E9G5_UNCEI|nr:DNA gyrase subunit A [Candidatus Eisenbacteria bacterium]